MNRKRTIINVFVFLLLTMNTWTTLLGQTKAGVDVYSRYIFRGSDYGDALSFQPSLTYVLGDLSVGLWGAYAEKGLYSEADLCVTYVVGPATVYLTDYYIPTLTPGVPFFNYNLKGSGAHVVEVGAGYTGPETMPFSVSGYINVLGDTLNSIYIQASYPLLSDLSLTIGLSPSKGIYTSPSSLHPASGAGLVSVGFIGTKTIKVSEDFSIPFNVQYIMNAYSETAFLIFGIRL